MQSLQFVFILMLAAGLAGWAIAYALFNWGRDDKKKIAQRLTGGQPGRTGDSRKSVLLQEVKQSALSAGLARRQALATLNRRLAQAFPDLQLSSFLSIAAILALFGWMVGWFITGSELIGLFAGAGAGYLPFLVMNQKRTKRQRLLNAQLPDALDFLSRSLKAGHSLSNALQLMADELPEPIAAEFRRTYAQHSLGQSLEDALRDMTERVDSKDFAFFVTSTLIQRQTGGDLSEVLRNISGMIRARFRIEQHTRAITAEARLTSMALMAFPPVMFVVSYALNPDYAGLLLNTSIGQMLIGLAAALQFIGFLVIRKIVAVKM